MAEGNKHLAYKDLLNGLEVESPGAKRAFYFGFLERAAEAFAADVASDSDVANKDDLGVCDRCGSPSAGEVCSFCRLTEQVVSFTPRPKREPSSP